MPYEVLLSERAAKQIRKLDKYSRLMISNWIRINLEGTDDPFRHGKALTGDRKGLWRYRVGDYRLISIIEEGRLVILVVDVGHRSTIYSE